MNGPPSSRCTVTMHDPRGGSGHRHGVNALASHDDASDLMYSGGRDATIRCWDSVSGQCVWTLAEHTDWINALVVLAPGLIATASSDCTVRLWCTSMSSSLSSAHDVGDDVPADTSAASAFSACSSSDAPAGVRCEVIGRHDDYAKCLSYSKAGRLLASAGLDKRVMVWDTAKLQSVLAEREDEEDEEAMGEANRGGGGGGGGFVPLSASDDDVDGGHTDSIYALSLKPDGALLASGSVDTTIVLWGPRRLSQGPLAKLEGHGDVVRQLVWLDGSSGSGGSSGSSSL